MTATLSPRRSAGARTARRHKPRRATHAPLERAQPEQLVSLGDLAYLLYPVVPRSWLFSLARLRGLLRWAWRRRDRRAVSQNIREIFGHEVNGAEVGRYSRRFFQNQMVQNLLATLVPRLSTAELERLLPISGLEHLERAMASGRGVVLMGSHLNSVLMFVLIPLLRRRGFDVRVAMPVRRDAWHQTRLRKLADRLAGRPNLKEELGAFFAQFNIRPIVARMREGAAIAMTGDGWHSAAFVEMDFLGRRLPFPTGAMNLARTTGALVVPVFELGELPERMFAVVEPAIEVPRNGNAKRDLEAAVSVYARRLERHVRAHIAGWQHLLVPDMLHTLTDWPRRPIAQRYHF
jgi:KDO2-lipid IV(A) lauroyltransferase